MDNQLKNARSIVNKSQPTKQTYGVDIWCQKSPELKAILTELAPEIEFFEWDFIAKKPSDLQLNNPKQSVFSIKNHSAESKLYPFEISLDKLDKQFWTYQRIYNVVKHISKKENTSCLVEYFDAKKPYYSLLFQFGNVFLVDDSEFDNSQKDVTIITKMPKI